MSKGSIPRRADARCSPRATAHRPVRASRRRSAAGAGHGGDKRRRHEEMPRPRTGNSRSTGRGRMVGAKEWNARLRRRSPPCPQHPPQLARRGRSRQPTNTPVRGISKYGRVPGTLSIALARVASDTRGTEGCPRLWAPAYARGQRRCGPVPPQAHRQVAGPQRAYGRARGAVTARRPEPGQSMPARCSTALTAHTVRTSPSQRR